MEFLRGQDGLPLVDDPVKAYILKGGWSPATIKHYNAGVTKLLAFALEKRIHRSLLLPIDRRILGLFAVWAGPKMSDDDKYHSVKPIKSSTIRTYLSGMKAWHLYHNFQYPHESNTRVELILTTAAKLELLETPRDAKGPILIRHLLVLLEALAGGSAEDHVEYVVALVAFWGMARLGELLKPPRTTDVVRLKDLVWNPAGRFVKIRIRAAKTAAVGEIQEIHLTSQNSLLDPVSAI